MMPAWMHKRRRRTKWWWELTRLEIDVLAALCHGQAAIHRVHPDGTEERERQYRMLAQKLRESSRAMERAEDA